ncbi:MAG: hypothetical protein ACOCVP_05965 [Wenzhouxiangella sp.]
MIRRLTVLALLALALGGAGAALADRQRDGDMLLIEKVMERMNRDLPGNGQSMAEVERRFGPPTERAPAVGEPPITRWTYDGYSVYFEHDRVIESVLHPDVVMREVSNGRD